MLVLQNVVKNVMQNIGRYLLFGAIGFVVIIIPVTAFCINNAKANNITVVDTIGLECDININQNGNISAYTLTVTGYIRTGNAYADEIPPMVFRSFDLVTDGTIESVENIVLSVRVNGCVEVQYDIAYAVLDEVYIDRDKCQ